MTSALLKRLRAYQAQTFRTAHGRRVTSKEEAISFVNERGFTFFWPIKDVVLPSLWAAVAGDRPVADAHDDPGHVTWGWKDSLLGQRKWYYAKVLRRKSTLIALDTVPYFYALSQNFGSPESDYLLQYEQGLLSKEAKSIYEALLNEGPLHSVQLRRTAGLSSRESEYRFNRALLELESDFKILPVGVADAGGWHYAFISDIAARYYPELPDRARALSPSAARRKLAELYLRSIGAVKTQDVMRLFGWKRAEAEGALSQCALEGLVQGEMEIAGASGVPGEWWVLCELI